MNLKHLKKYILNLFLIDDLRKSLKYRFFVIKIDFVFYYFLIYLVKISNLKKKIMS